MNCYHEQKKDSKEQIDFSLHSTYSLWNNTLSNTRFELIGAYGHDGIQVFLSELNHKK